MSTVHSTSAATDLQEVKSETLQDKDAYRAPRLVTLGTAVGLVQGFTTRYNYDGRRGFYGA
jgi:hypothetical protein